MILLLNMHSNRNQHRQATPKTVEVYGGSGLGLNISRKICQLHGGEVGLSSKAGDGSTFGFFFKTKRPEQTELDVGCIQEQEIADTSLEYQIKQLCALEKIDASSFSRDLVNSPAKGTGDAIAHIGDQEGAKYQNTAQAESNTPEKEPAHQGRRTHGLDHESQDQSRRAKEQASPAQQHTGAHILLVEDNIINQKIVVRKLESRGYVVTAANNGKEAVELVERAPGLSTGDKGAFNICLMDMEMPVMDGNSATKMIRKFEKQGRIEHIPILGVTANVRLEQQAEM
jgi:CheY-like chemotaxis protein